MSFESVLEQQRRFHEERERLMDTMTKEMLRKKATVSTGFHQEDFRDLLNVFSIEIRSILNMWSNC